MEWAWGKDAMGYGLLAIGYWLRTKVHDDHAKAANALSLAQLIKFWRPDAAHSP
jgi:hypothetical protein